MALTESTDLPVGTPAPAFSLPDTVSGDTVSLADAAGKPVLIVFMCNHCPYVLHILEPLVSLAAALEARGIATIAISANDVAAYPADAPERMAALARQQGFGFPYLHDASQDVARAYGAVCTPDPYLFDAEHRLFYRGQFDGTRPGQGIADGSDLMRAAEELLAGRDRPSLQKPSIGCSIKWKAA